MGEARTKNAARACNTELSSESQDERVEERQRAEQHAMKAATFPFSTRRRTVARSERIWLRIWIWWWGVGDSLGRKLGSSQTNGYVVLLTQQRTLWDMSGTPSLTGSQSHCFGGRGGSATLCWMDDDDWLLHHDCLGETPVDLLMVEVEF